MKIVIVDYGMGNLKSVYNALILLGFKAKVSDSAEDIRGADKLILPGVGAFGDAMEGLEKRKLMQPIKDFLKSGKIYLGICLGLQILFEKSEEGSAKGFGIFKGNVRKFKGKLGLKIPHMGWNQIKLKTQKSQPKADPLKAEKVKTIPNVVTSSENLRDPVEFLKQKTSYGTSQNEKVKILEDIADGVNFYFVHSYYAQPQDEDIVMTTTVYGEEFASMVNKGNIYATQFHPEKSQDIGLKFLKNFMEL